MPFPEGDTRGAGQAAPLLAAAGIPEIITGMRRRLLALLALCSLAVGTLAACAAPNTEAADAAEDYTAALARWEPVLVAAASEEPVVAADGAVDWPSLAEALASAPTLAGDLGAIEDGNPYLRIAPVADRVDVIVDELSALEESTQLLGAEALLAYYAYSSAYLTRASALSDVVFDADPSAPDWDETLLQARLDFWGKGVDEAATYRDALLDVLPDTPHGASLAAYAQAEVAHLTAGLETASELADAEGSPPLFDALGQGTPDLTVAVIAPHYARGILTRELVAAVSELVRVAEARLDGDEGVDADLPRASDAYRVAVIERMPSAASVTADPRSVVDPDPYASRWMLWRMAELDGVEFERYAEAAAIVGLRVRGANDAFSVLQFLEKVFEKTTNWGPSTLEPLHDGHLELAHSYAAFEPYLVAPGSLADPVDRFRDALTAGYAGSTMSASEVDAAAMDAWAEAVAEMEDVLAALRALVADDEALRDAMQAAVGAARD